MYKAGSLIWHCQLRQYVIQRLRLRMGSPMVRLCNAGTIISIDLIGELCGGERCGSTTALERPHQQHAACQWRRTAHTCSQQEALGGRQARCVQSGGGAPAHELQIQIDS